jgi:acyl-CoA reductase-like NAD-dependent aldehyde dehydrogenase
MFFTLEHSATIEKVEGYVPSEKVLRKFFKWQSRSFPKKHSLLYAFGDVPFDHKDDLTWLECAKADALLREDDREANAKLSANQKTDFNMDCLNG